MADKVSLTPEEEVTKLRARVKELETRLANEERSKEQPTGRARTVADSWSDASQAKRDAASRIVRGVTLASVEGMRLFADSVSSFADNVISRSDASNRKSAKSLAMGLPGDIAASLADTVSGFVDIPARVAERYSKAHRETQKPNDPETK